MKISRDIKTTPLQLPFSITFNNLVFIQKSIFKDLNSRNPHPESVAVLIHELEHRKRMRKIGIWKHSWKYWTSPKFRFQEEIAAIIPQVQYLKSHGLKYDSERKAKLLSGFPYLWCVSYSRAKETLDKIFKKS